MKDNAVLTTLCKNCLQGSLWVLSSVRVSSAWDWHLTRALEPQSQLELDSQWPCLCEVFNFGCLLKWTDTYLTEASSTCWKNLLALPQKCPHLRIKQ